MRFQRKPLTDWIALYAKVESLPDAVILAGVRRCWFIDQ